MTKQYKTATIQVERIQYFSYDIVVPANLEREDLVEWLEREHDPLETMVDDGPDFEEFASHDADVDNTTSFPITKDNLKIHPDHWFDEEGFWFDPHSELRET